MEPSKQPQRPDYREGRFDSSALQIALSPSGICSRWPLQENYHDVTSQKPPWIMVYIETSLVDCYPRTRLTRRYFEIFSIVAIGTKGLSNVLHAAELHTLS